MQEWDHCTSAARIHTPTREGGPMRQGMNTLKTGLLMAGLTALLMAIGYWLGNTTGMIYCFILAAAMNFVTYWYSDKMVLAMTGAQEVTPAEAPQLFALVSRLVE